MKVTFNEEKYRIINKFLNEYCTDIEGSFFYNNLKNIEDLTEDVNEIIKSIDPKYSSDDKKLFDFLNPDFRKLSIDLSIFDSIDIVRTYITEKTPEYLEEFETFLTDGSIDVILREEDETEDNKYQEYRNDSYCGYHKSHFDITLDMEHNYQDPPTIIHEFMHSRNVNTTTSTLKGSRRILTEAVSIYFETDLYKFMIEEGYDEDEIKKAFRYRINDCYMCCQEIIPQLRLIEAFEKLGPITDSSYEESKKFGILEKDTSREFFDKNIDILVQDIEQRHFNPRKAFYYIFGTVIAYGAIAKEDPLMPKKFMDLNNNLINDVNALDCLALIGIDLTKSETTPTILSSFENTLKELNQIKSESINTL